MSRKLQMALRLRENAEQHVVDILQSDYPLDAEIRWRDGKSIHHGRVLMHCPSDRIKVYNQDTLKQRFIRAYQVQP